MPLPPSPYDARDKRPARVSSLSLVRYKGNDYSVPVAYGYHEVLVRGYVDEVVTLITSNLPFDEWTEVFGSERLTGALLDRLTQHVHLLEMNGESSRLKQSRSQQGYQGSITRQHRLPTRVHRPHPRAAPRQPFEGTPRRARGPPMDYVDKLRGTSPGGTLLHGHTGGLLRRR